MHLGREGRGVKTGVMLNHGERLKILRWQVTNNEGSHCKRIQSLPAPNVSLTMITINNKDTVSINHADTQTDSSRLTRNVRCLFYCNHNSMTERRRKCGYFRPGLLVSLSSVLDFGCYGWLCCSPVANLRQLGPGEEAFGAVRSSLIVSGILWKPSLQQLWLSLQELQNKKWKENEKGGRNGITWVA